MYTFYWALELTLPELPNCQTPHELIENFNTGMFSFMSFFKTMITMKFKLKRYLFSKINLLI